MHMHVRFTTIMSRASLFCRECVIIEKFSRKMRVDITLLQMTMYKSYLFCANYALFVLSSFVDRTILAIFGWRFQSGLFSNATLQ